MTKDCFRPIGNIRTGYPEAVGTVYHDGGYQYHLCPLTNGIEIAQELNVPYSGYVCCWGRITKSAIGRDDNCRNCPFDDTEKN